MIPPEAKNEIDRANAVGLANPLALLEWAQPGGRQEGKRYVCASASGGAGQSCSTLIAEMRGTDFAGDGEKWNDAVSLVAKAFGLPMRQAARQILERFGTSAPVGPTRQKPKAKPANVWTPILPVPDDAPAPDFRRPRLGKPVAHWTYRDAEGRVLGHDCRFEPKGERKQVLPLTYCQNSAGKCSWEFKSFPEPRPLYGLDRLAKAAPDAEVMLGEGCKTADGAQRLLPGMVCMTGPGGSSAVGKVDLNPLKGRKVLVWPDADEPGRKAAKVLASRLKQAGAEEVFVIDPPEGVSEGWDLADAEAEGWDTARVMAHIQACRDRRESAPAPAPDPEISPHMEMARACLASFGAGNVLYALGGFWRYDSGVWRAMDAQAVKQAAHKLYPGRIRSANTTNSILELAKTEAFVDGQVFAPAGMRSVNVKNGVLHWNGQAWELRPHRREDYATSQLPVAYDANAAAPRFEQFLAEVFQGDEDADEKAILLCEALGYSILTTAEMEKFFLLIGAGANGKSVLLNTLEAFVGRENACAVQPSQFENRFQRAHLHGKLVNVVSEIAEGAEIADAQLKAIVSGELTTAEHKLRPPFDFRPYSTCWFGTNHLPHTRDFSQALFRRALVIPFNRVFEEHEQDKLLLQKLKAELPGILNLALDGAARLFARGVFTTPKSSTQAATEWRVQADQVAQFAEDCCRFRPDAKVSSKELFERYQEWAGEAGIAKKVNRKNFSDRMTRLGACIHRGTGGNRLLLGVEVAA